MDTVQFFPMSLVKAPADLLNFAHSSLTDKSSRTVCIMTIIFQLSALFAYAFSHFNRVWFILFLAGCTSIIDILQLPNFKKNTKIANLNGFSNFRIYLYMVMNMLIIYPFQCLVLLYFIPTPPVLYFDISLLVRVIGYLGIIEFVFTPIHLLLHQ